MLYYAEYTKGICVHNKTGDYEKAWRLHFMNATFCCIVRYSCLDQLEKNYSTLS